MPVLGVEHDEIIKRKTEKRSIQEMFANKATLIATITNVDNSGGLIRITAPSHGLSTGDEVIIADVGGTTEANAFWTVTNVSSSQFTLDGSTYTNAYTSGGGVYNGVRYSIDCGSAPGTDGILVTCNLKKVSTSGAVVSLPVVVKKITTSDATEIFKSDSSYDQAVSSLVLTNNSGGSITGDITIQTTKLYNVPALPIINWVLADGYSLVVGGDGVRSLYKETALPYVA